jgi:hypothetical protein
VETIAPPSPSAVAAASSQVSGEAPPPGAGALRWPLAIVLVLAALLALAAQWERSLLDDEVGTMVAVARSAGELTTTFDEWITQPAFFLAAKPFVALLGDREAAIRLPALLAALGGLVALAALGARLLDVRLGWLAALLLALQPYHLFYSQMGRGYTLAAALSTTSLVLLLALARGAGTGTGIAYVVVRALSVYTHLGACGSGLAELAVAFGVARPAGGTVFRRTLGWLAAGAAGSALLYLPLLDDLRAFRETWSGSAGEFGWGFAPLVLTAYAGGRGLSVFAWGVAVLAGIAIAWRRSRVAGLCLALWPLGLLGFYALNATVHYPWAFARFLFPALPAFALASAVALDALARAAGARRFALPVVVALFLALTAFKTPEIAFGPRDPDWRAVIARLEAAGVRPRDAFALPLRFNGFQHYLARHEGLAFDQLGPARLDHVLRKQGVAGLSGRRLAFVVDLVSFDEATHAEQFAIERFGPATLLVARPELPQVETTAVAVTRAVLEEVVHQRAALPRGPIRSDWVYWRIDRRHEHAFVAETELAIEWAVLARLARAAGDRQAAGRARAKVAELRRGVRLPGQVRASWSLLGPHWDVLR